MLDTKVKNTCDLEELLNYPFRRYIVTEQAKTTYEKEFLYIQYDIKLARHANDLFGGISDCYIMYAIAKLGFADLLAIQKFLKVLKKNNPSINIMDVTNGSNLRSRLSSLYKNGFIFRATYYILDPVKKTDIKNILYSIDYESQNFMAQKLGKRVPPNKWIQAKPIEDIIALAAASHVGTQMALNDNFVEFKDAIFKTPKIGTVMLPNEIKMLNDDAEYHVTTIPAFLYFSPERWSENDYIESIVYKIGTIQNYIYHKINSKKNPRIVVVVESKEDLEKMKNYIVRTEVLLDSLEYIFFTGEEMIKQVPNQMLRIKKLNKEQYGFEIISPDFLN